jgi:hypothetical protein
MLVTFASGAQRCNRSAHNLDSGTTVDTQAGTDADADAFRIRMIEVMADASIALLLSLGHQPRLFDTMAALPRAASTQIAVVAGLNDAMCANGWVDW